MQSLSSEPVELLNQVLAMPRLPSWVADTANDEDDLWHYEQALRIVAFESRLSGRFPTLKMETKEKILRILASALRERLIDALPFGY